MANAPQRRSAVTGEPDVHAGDVVTIHIKCLVRYGENPTTYDDGEESSGDELGAEDARLDEAQKKKKKQLLEDSLQRVIAYAPRFPEVREPRRGGAHDEPVLTSRGPLASVGGGMCVQPKQQKFWVFVVDKQGASFITDVYGRPLSLQEVNGTIKVRRRRAGRTHSHATFLSLTVPSAWAALTCPPQTKRGPAVKVDFLLPTRPSDKPVNRKLRVFVMCDSYYGAVATADVEVRRGGAAAWCASSASARHVLTALSRFRPRGPPCRRSST